jgi:PAT family beta-lactamase induction signal transducer AmpG
MAWALGVGLVATVYGVGRVWNGFAMPKAKLDQPVAVTTMADNKVHIYRTILVVAVFFTGYFTIAPIGRYLMHFLASALPQAEAIQVYLFDENYALDIAGASATLVPGNGFVLNAGLFVIMGLLTLALSLEIKRVMSGSVIGKSFSTFVLQKGFIAIFAFILLYRFAEGLVVKMVPLFLANEPEEGGMGMSTEAVGIAYGTLGVGGLVVGGILGGIIVAKLDLRKVFLPLASTIHIPNLLYWWASYNLPGRVSENYSMVEGNFLDKALYFFTPEFWAANTEIMQISGIVFLDQFGYGLGFAAYLVYLMQAAQRGEFVTSHYAIMTAMGALGLMVAGILSGVLENLFGFTGFFFAVVLFAIPGLATIYFIPYDRKPGPKGGGMAKKPEDEEQEAA